jgi:hypothetical protein
MAELSLFLLLEKLQEKENFSLITFDSCGQPWKVAGVITVRNENRYVAYVKWYHKTGSIFKTEAISMKDVQKYLLEWNTDARKNVIPSILRSWGQMIKSHHCGHWHPDDSRRCQDCKEYLGNRFPGDDIAGELCALRHFIVNTRDGCCDDFSGLTELDAIDELRRAIFKGDEQDETSTKD